MHRSAMNRRRDRSGGGAKGAHNRETLQTTGRTTRIVIVPREFAPIPHAPAGLPIPMAIRMRFLRHDGIYRSDVVQTTKTKPWGGTVPPPAGRPRAQVKERAGRITLSSSSAMSSGRLFLDRVGRHQSPSPLHRHEQINMHSSGDWAKRDVSTLPTRGHFYFALTTGRIPLDTDSCFG
jgi:hypothetical protein